MRKNRERSTTATTPDSNPPRCLVFKLPLVFCEIMVYSKSRNIGKNGVKKQVRTRASKAPRARGFFRAKKESFKGCFLYPLDGLVLIKMDKKKIARVLRKCLRKRKNRKVPQGRSKTFTPPEVGFFTPLKVGILYPPTRGDLGVDPTTSLPQKERRRRRSLRILQKRSILRLYSNINTVDN